MQARRWASALVLSAGILTWISAAGEDLPTVNIPEGGIDDMTVGGGENNRTYGNVTVSPNALWKPPDTSHVKGVLDWAGTISMSNGGLYIKGGAKFHDGACYEQTVFVNPGTTEYKSGTDRSVTIWMNDGLEIVGSESATINLKFNFEESLLSNAPTEVTLYSPGDSGDGLLVAYIKRRSYADKAKFAEFCSKLNFQAPDYIYDGSADAPLLQKYLVQTEISTKVLGQNGFEWYAKSIHLTNTSLASEAVMSAADNQRALFNMWRMNDSHVFQRGESLRMGHAAHSGNTWRESEPKVAEGLWANVYRGKYKFDSPYGRKVNQSYTSLFVGFDKMNEGDFHNGTLYRGVFADIGTSDASYPTGKGELESKGLGAYVTWQGNKGHFLDAAVRFDKLDNEYTYVANSVSGKNKYDTWAWGVSGQYGYHKDWESGAYIEPLVGLSYGRMNATSYTLHNGLAFDQKGGDFLVGRAGLRFGKVFGDEDNGTNVYGKVMLSHEFLDAADAATSFGGNILKVKPIGEKDTWTDVTLGVSKAFAKRGSGYVEFTRSLGGDVRSDWQVAAGLSFYWDPEPKHNSQTNSQTNSQAHADSTNEQFFTAANSTGTIAQLASDAAVTSNGTGRETEASARVLPSGAEGTMSASANMAGAAAAAEPSSANAAQTNAGEGAGYGTTSFSRAGTYGSAESGVYELAPVTVEADRPVWEKNLSPGTVSVVYPEAYKGEMKTVPDMLDSVAGVFVQRVNGTGHYTLARVRGSTGQQVNVYVDGVLMNSSGETGVDLSQLPTEQIERIEVYKGYIPARFAGAAIGGAINIVTKKPDGATGSVGFGMRSYGGYTENLSVTTPVGEGTLLFTLNRDQSDGDFGYTWHPYTLLPVIESSKEQSGDRLWRQNNWYRMTDAMVKWQDDHWLVKAQYVEKNEGAPVSAWSTTGDNWNHDAAGNWHHYYPASQKNKNTDILIGRRQQTGDVEWGAYLNYGNHEKRNSYHGKYTDHVMPGVSSYFKHDFWGARLDGNWKVNDSNMLEFLFNYSDETMKTDGNTYGSGEFTGNTNYSRAFLPKYNIKHYYFQVQDSMALDRRKTLLFTPEWRAEKMEMETFTHGHGEYNKSMPRDMDEAGWKYSYGLGLKKYIADNWTFHGSYGTYYRAPNFYELFGDGGVFVRPRPYNNSGYAGSAVTYESGTQYDIGTDWKGRTLGADTNVSLTYFNRHVENMASPVYTADGTAYYANLGEGKIDGIELEADWSWKNWELSQTVTYNHSRMDKVVNSRDGSQAVDVSERGLTFPMTPKWETNTRLSYFFHDRKMSAFAEYHYTSDMIYAMGDYTGSTGTPNYYESLGTFNLGFKYNPEHWRFTVGVNDLFNKGPKQKFIWEDGAISTNVFYPQQGRTYYFSAQYSF